MTDIVERLRTHDNYIRGKIIQTLPDHWLNDMIEAADEIEQLRLDLYKAKIEIEANNDLMAQMLFEINSAAIEEGKE